MKRAFFAIGTEIVLAPEGEDRAVTVERAQRKYLHDLKIELDQIEKECCSTVLDQVNANLREVNRRRGKPMSKREYKRKEDLVQLCVAHAVLRDLLCVGRAGLSDGILPTPDQINLVRETAERVRGLRMSYLDKALSFNLGGQNAQKENVRSRRELARLVKAKRVANKKLTHSGACDKVGGDLGLAAGYVRSLVHKSDYRLGK
jgi:hypothetical protein